MSRFYGTSGAAQPPKRKTPKICPRCESPNLIHFERELICQHCSWDSIELNANPLIARNSPPRSFEDDSSYGREESESQHAQLILCESAFMSQGLAFI